MVNFGHPHILILMGIFYNCQTVLQVIEVMFRPWPLYQQMVINILSHSVVCEVIFFHLKFREEKVDYAVVPVINPIDHIMIKLCWVN